MNIVNITKIFHEFQLTDGSSVSIRAVDQLILRRLQYCSAIFMSVLLLFGGYFYNSFAAEELPLSVSPNFAAPGQTITLYGKGFKNGARALVWSGGPFAIGSVDTPGFADGFAVAGNFAYVADGLNGLQLIDISNPQAPVLSGRADTPGSARDVAIAGNYAYVADFRNGLQVIDISNSQIPVLAGSVDVPGFAITVAIVGNFAYVGGGYKNGLQVIDITQPEAPVLVGSFDNPDYALGFAIAGNFVYAATNFNGLQVLDSTDPGSPVVVSSTGTPGFSKSIANAGNFSYIADADGGLQVIDIRNPYAPVLVGGSAGSSSYATGVVLAENFAYVVDALSGLQLFDITHAQAPMLVDSIANPIQNISYNSIAIAGNFVYVMDYRGLSIFPLAYSLSTFFNNSDSLEVVLPPDLPDGFYDITVLNPDGTVYRRRNAVTVSDPVIGLSVQHLSFDEIPIGTESPIQTVTLTNGGNVDLQVGTLLIAGSKPDNFSFASDTCSEEILAANDTCTFAVKFTPVNFGLLSAQVSIPSNSYGSPQVIELSGLAKELPLSVAPEIAAPGQTVMVNGEGFEDGARTFILGAGPYVTGSIDTIGDALDVVVAGNFAYVAGDNHGLQVSDISNPQLPVLVGSADTPGRARSVAIAGNYIYVADGGEGLQVIDITHPQTPVVVGSAEIDDESFDVAIAGNFAYVAFRYQWGESETSSDHGLAVIDISLPHLPVLIDIFKTPGSARSVTIAGNYAYVADGESGLQVIDIINPHALVLVGSSDTPGFAQGVAVAGNYAYVADAQSGLQVIEITNPHAPVGVASAKTDGSALAVAIAGSFAYIAIDDNGLKLFEISHPQAPVLVGSADTGGPVLAVAVAGNFVYVADGPNGLAIFPSEFSSTSTVFSNSTSLEATLPSNQLDGAYDVIVLNPDVMVYKQLNALEVSADASIPGDLNKDGVVNDDDLKILLAARNTPAESEDDPRDLNGDGFITGLDARELILLCTRPRCATK